MPYLVRFQNCYLFSKKPRVGVNCISLVEVKVGSRRTPIVQKVNQDRKHQAISFKWQNKEYYLTDMHILWYEICSKNS